MFVSEVLQTVSVSSRDRSDISDLESTDALNESHCLKYVHLWRGWSGMVEGGRKNGTEVPSPGD